MDIYIYGYINIYVCVYIHVYMYIFTYLCIYVCIYVCMYTYTCNCMYTYSYIYIYSEERGREWTIHILRRESERMGVPVHRGCKLQEEYTRVRYRL